MKQQTKFKQTEIGRMPEGWQTKKLGEVCEVGAGNSAPQRKEMFEAGEYPFFRTSDVGKIHLGIINTSVDMLNEKGIRKLKLFPKGTLLFPKSGASTFLNHRVLMGVDGYVSSHLATIKAKEKFLLDFFLYYYSRTIDSRQLMQDQNYPSLRLSDISIIEINLPSLEEQKQIVKILDEVFESISKSKENAEKNLKNARELFESYLEEIFSNPKEDWEEKKLGEVLKLEYGKPLDKKNRSTKGKYPVYGANGEKDRSDKFYYDKKSIIVGRKGSAGEINLTEEKFWPLDVTYFITLDDKKYDLMFIYYLLTKLNLPSLAKGVKPGINRNEVYAIKKSFPKSLATQTAIVQKLDALSKEIKQLEEIYKQKLKDLEELKKSMLQKAFSGELTNK